MLISQRCEQGSALITRNFLFEEWTETFNAERLTRALLDRLRHHVNILKMNGESYRLNQSRAKRRHTKAQQSQTPKISVSWLKNNAPKVAFFYAAIW